jgi:hypothetical protein
MKSGEEMAMATIRWISGLAAALMLLANGMLCSQAVSAELPVPTKQAAQPTRPMIRTMSRTCTTVDGHTFRWDQPNAPFAALCPFEDNAPAPAPPKQTPK